MPPKSKLPIDELLKQHDVGRDGASRIMAGSKPFHGWYNRARDFVMAIDELVEVLSAQLGQFPGFKRDRLGAKQAMQRLDSLH